MELVEYTGKVVGIRNQDLCPSVTSHADPHVRRRHDALYFTVALLD